MERSSFDMKLLMNQHFKKIIIFAAISAALVRGLYYFQQNDLVHFKIAQHDFEQDKNQYLFELRKQQLQKYYTCGNYENDVKGICQKAARCFSSLCVKKDSLVIFDIDDTAVYHYQVNDKFDFIWSQCPQLVKARQTDRGPAIEPVLELYNILLKKDFKIIFLSSRNAGDYNHTHNELTQAGYTTFEQIILMPDELAFDRSIKTADWKLSIRKELAKRYTIVGCIGDRDKDFEGGYTGHVIKLPNYLY